MTNLKAYTYLFGDSSYIVHYLRWLGYDLTHVRADRVELRHRGEAREPLPERHRQRDDGRRRPVDHQRRLLQHVVPGVPGQSVGAHSFLGNRIAYPSQGRVGDNCLLGTKVLVPIDGKVRRGRGAARLAQLRDPANGRAGQHVRPPGATRRGLRRRLAAKNRHNLVTMGLFLLVRWLFVFVVTLIASAAADLYPSEGAGVVAVANVVILAVQRRSTSCWSTGSSRCSARCGRCSARSTTAGSGGTSGSGRCPR